MKATGVVRRVDDLGRVVIPKEIRRTLKIKAGDKLELFTEKDGVICLKKFPDEPDFSEANEFVQRNHGVIACVLPFGDGTVVIFSDGKRVTVNRNPQDKYNLSVAIVYAFKRAGFSQSQVGGYPDWVY